MKTAVVTGAFGFAGANLVEYLLSKDIKVYAVGRKHTSSANAGEKTVRNTHNERFSDVPEEKMVKVFLEMSEYDRLPEYIDEKVDLFFHLAWGGGREDFAAQYANIEGSLKALEAAAQIGRDICFVGIGSQAEYGVKSDKEPITEDMLPEPFSAYGACKAAAFYLLKNRAQQLGVRFVWGRIFSLIGKYEPSGRMLPDLVLKLRNGQEVNLSSCEQYWDYMDAADAAKAMYLLGEKGISGEAYNIAKGDSKPLSEFVYEAADHLGADRALIHMNQRVSPFVSIRPSVEKLKSHTGWEEETSFCESIDKYLQ